PLTGKFGAARRQKRLIPWLGSRGRKGKEDLFSMDDLLNKGGAGDFGIFSEPATAATVSHVRRLRYKDRVLELPPIEERTVGPAVREKLLGIMTGRDPDPYGWVEQV